MAELTKRIKSAKDYIIRDDAGNMLQVLCRLCGTPIQSWVDDDVISVDNINGEKVAKIRQKFKRLANYAQVTFQMEDGSLYEPPICKGCVPKANSVEAGEKMFACHLKDLHKRNLHKHAEEDCKCKIKCFVGEKHVR